MTRAEAERRIAEGIVAAVHDAAPLVRRMVAAMIQTANALAATLAKMENPND